MCMLSCTCPSVRPSARCSNKHVMPRPLPSKPITHLFGCLQVKFVTKRVFRATLSLLFGLAPPALRLTLQPPVPLALEASRPAEKGQVRLKEDGVAWDVDTAARFLNYAAVVVAVVGVGQLVINVAA